MFLCRRILLKTYFAPKSSPSAPGVRYFVTAALRSEKTYEHDSSSNVARIFGLVPKVPQQTGISASRQELDVSSLLTKLQVSVERSRKRTRTKSILPEQSVRRRGRPRKGSSHGRDWKVDRSPLEISRHLRRPHPRKGTPLPDSEKELLDFMSIVSVYYFPPHSPLPPQLLSRSHPDHLRDEFDEPRQNLPTELDKQSKTLPEELQKQSTQNSSEWLDEDGAFDKAKAEQLVQEICSRDFTRDRDRHRKSLTLYLYYRALDRAQLSTLSRAMFYQSGCWATAIGRSDLWDDIAKDMLEFYTGDSEQRCETISKFLSIRDGPKAYEASTVIAMFRDWIGAGEHGSLSPRALNLIVDAIRTTYLTTPRGSSFETPIIQQFVDLAFRYTKQEPVWAHMEGSRRSIPRTVSVLFELIRAYISIEHYDAALDLFQRLVDLDCIPRDALHHAETLYESTMDFRLIVCTALMKTCFQWGWRVRAARFLIDVMLSTKDLNAEIKASTEEALENLLQKPTLDCFQHALQIASLFITRTSPESPLPNAIISRFYLQAWSADRKLGEHSDGGFARVAESMYAMTRRSGNLEKHVYPPPEGRFVPWLLKQMIFGSKTISLARELVQQITTGSMYLPIHCRAEVIKLATSAAFATEARTLWMRYAEEEESLPPHLKAIRKQDVYLVAGNGGVATRMVRLFRHLAEKEKATLATLSQSKKHRKQLHVSPQPAQDTTGLMTHEEQLGYHQSRLKDYEWFATHVMQRFRASIGPPQRADHMKLNALARIYFVLGKMSLGFGVFKTLINRMEAPDVQDLNVALSILVTYDTQAAGRIIESMAQKGLQPDGITMGTVLHGAMAAGDNELVDRLLEQANSLRVGLSMKGLTAGVYACISRSMATSPPEVLAEHLDMTLNMIRSLERESYLPTVNTGKLCVRASLRAQSSQLAFEFWKMLLKDKAEWADQSHTYMRRRIAGQVRREVLDGRLDRSQAEEMVDMLGLAEAFDVGKWHPVYTTIPEGYDG